MKPAAKRLVAAAKSASFVIGFADIMMRDGEPMVSFNAVELIKISKRLDKAVADFMKENE